MFSLKAHQFFQLQEVGVMQHLLCLLIKNLLLLELQLTPSVQFQQTLWALQMVKTQVCMHPFRILYLLD